MRPSCSIRLLVSLVILVLSGCGGGGDDSAATVSTADTVAVTIRDIRVIGEVSETRTVSVNGTADSDPGPTTFDAQIPFSDPGMTRPLNATVTVLATDTAGHRVTSDIVITADPAIITTP